MASHNHFALQAIAILRLLTRKVTQAVRLDTASESCALVLGGLLVAAGYTCVSRAETKPIELSPQQLQLDIGLTAEPLWIDLRGPFFDALAVAYSETAAFAQTSPAGPAVAELLRQRSALAQTGVAVEPLMPTGQLSFHAASELNEARQWLTVVLRDPWVLYSFSLSTSAALAQARFDCWAEEEIVAAASGKTNFSVCRSKFMQAREEVLAATKSRLESLQGWELLPVSPGPGRGRQSWSRSSSSVGDVSDQAVIQFPVDSPTLSATAQTRLANLAEQFRHEPILRIVLRGIANLPDAQDRATLANQRADAVDRFLVRSGVPPQAIVVTDDLPVPSPSEEARLLSLESGVEVYIQTGAMQQERLQMLGTVYDYLPEFGTEPQGYGLYSYILFPYQTNRVALFLRAVVGATARASQHEPDRLTLNLLLIPTRTQGYMTLRQKQGSTSQEISRVLAEEAYDYSSAERIFRLICRNADPRLVELCAGSRGQGPYLFSYVRPITNLDAIPPPYLFADLSGVHEEALPIFLNAYKEQVLRTDYTDLERIETLRLKFLNWVLYAKDVLHGVISIVPDMGKILYISKVGKNT